MKTPLDVQPAVKLVSLLMTMASSVQIGSEEFSRFEIMTLYSTRSRMGLALGA